MGSRVFVRASLKIISGLIFCKSTELMRSSAHAQVMKPMASAAQRWRLGLEEALVAVDPTTQRLLRFEVLDPLLPSKKRCARVIDQLYLMSHKHTWAQQEGGLSLSTFCPPTADVGLQGPRQMLMPVVLLAV